MKRPYFVRTIILAGSLLLQLSPLCFHSRGAAGDVDLSFDPGSGINGWVNAVAVQPDGKVLIGGYFTTVKGLARTGVARLNADGSGDPTFNPGIAYNYPSLALKSDGKVLVGHASGVSRLNSDGSRDTSFNASIIGVTYLDEEGNPYFFPQSVSAVAVQPDGKVLIAGTFTAVGGTNRNGLARLNANGSLDASFDPGTGYPDIRSVVVQSDGKVLIGGGFIVVNGAKRSGIARLNANGSLDSTFDPGTGVGESNPSGTYWVSSVFIQSDGKVLIGGNFGTVNGTDRRGIARLNANGSLDGSFNPGTGGYVSGSGVVSVIVQSDGKVLIGGDFTTVNGTNRNFLSRLNADGSLDGTFDPGSGPPYAQISALAVQSDGKVFIAANRMARLNANGSADSSFDPGTEVQVQFYQSLALQPDGKVLLDDRFALINGTNRYGRTRLNADGSLDSTFIPNRFNPNIYNPTAVAVQPDGKVLVASASSTDCPDPETGCLITNSYFVNRLNADGFLDTSFEPVVQHSPWGYSEWVEALAVQPDGKVLVGGLFFWIKGASRNGIARLNTNGSLDGTFWGPLSFNSRVSSLAVQPDGKLIIAGDFPSLDGLGGRSQIARLHANGSPDTSFNTVLGTVYPYPPEPRSVVMQPDGKVLIGGSFTHVNNMPRNGIARLNTDGSLDLSFNPGTGANGDVRSLALQPDGKVLISGNFTAVNGVARPHVARLYGDSLAPTLSIARSNALMIISWPVTGLNFQLQETTDLSLPNSWSPVAQPAVTNAGQISVTVPTTAGQKFFRLTSQ